VDRESSAADWASSADRVTMGPSDARTARTVIRPSHGGSRAAPRAKLPTRIVRSDGSVAEVAVEAGFILNQGDTRSRSSREGAVDMAIARAIARAHP